MLKKNDIVTLEITSLTNEGNGVGRADGVAVFVPFTAPGDVISCRIVKVKSHYCYGIIDKIITPSPYRCEADCNAFGKCGGCSFRHIEYAEELSAKENFVRDAFERIGRLSPEFEPIEPSAGTECYRNKAQFPVSQDEEGKLFGGFYAKRSHRVIKMSDCKLIPHIFTEICEYMLDFFQGIELTAYNEETCKGDIRHIFIRKGEHSGEIMAAVVVTSLELADKFKPMTSGLTERFANIKSLIINENPDRTNRILGNKSQTIFGSDEICDTMCGNKITLSLNSFYQINTKQAERLYDIAQEYAELDKNQTLLDLYCGTGTIGLSMARSVKKLIGVEIVPSAIEDAKRNVAANGITNAEFICSDAGKAARLLLERGEKPDVIIADPARKGCTPDTLEAMAKMNPEKIIMISCNPATAARDCAILESYGYKAIKCKAVDMFPRTEHVETVVLMSRVKD